MRGQRWVLVLLLLGVLAGCTQTTHYPAPKATSGAGGAGDLEFRPVLQDVPATAGTGTAPTSEQRQSTDPTVQRQALDALGCRAGRPDPLAGHDAQKLPLLTCSQDGKDKYLLDGAALTAAHVKHASVDTSGPSPAVNLEFTPEGTVRWARFTRAHMGQQVAIVHGAQVLCAPTIQQAISGGTAQITGGLTFDQARRLADQLDHG
jgi:preprotein translocase subunit SecD